MRLNWNEIRSLDGDQRLGFEELCRQLARQEAPGEAVFEAKGRPDAGVECFCVLPSGKEWGWQAKFFTTSITDSQWDQIDSSVSTALAKHPKLEHYYVCVPHDLSDARSGRGKSESERWDIRLEKWQGWAHARDMEVEFVWWGSSELIERLSQERNAGRRKFWFGDHSTFSHDWFDQRLEEAIAAADERYTPKVNVELDVAQSLEMFGRSEIALDRIRSLAKEVKKEFQLLQSFPNDSHHIDEDFGLAALRREGARIVEAIDNLDFAPDSSPDISSVVSMLDYATSLVEQSTDRLYDLEQEYEETNEASRPPTSQLPSAYRFEEWRARLRIILRRLWAARSHLLDAAALLHGKVLILKGEAGAGKTHLLCAAAENRRDAGMPTVLLLGQQFGRAGNPWSQLLEQLSLETMTSDHFVGALEAAAQTAGCRALIMIDALNEGRGIDIWLDHIASFLKRVTRSPWISVLISVRTTYIDSVIPAQVLKQAVRLEHHGFFGKESEAVKIYFDHHRLELPSGPVLMPEFRRPLFLKTICEGLRDTGQKRMPQGFHGISAIFDLYLDAVNRRVARRTDHDPKDNLIRRALERLAKRMYEREQHALSRDEARELVDDLLPGRRFKNSLFQAMIAESVLLQEAGESASRRREERILITYQRFSDHVIADYLLDAHFDLEVPTAAFAETGGLAFVRTGDWWLGPIEALCVQLPEKYGLELFDLVPEALENPRAVRVFLASLVWRASDACSEGTHEVLDALIAGPESVSASDFFDTLLTVATIPGHAFNAEYLDSYLQRIEMADRDAQWSTYLHEVYGQETAVDRILDWATSLRQDDAGRLDDDAVFLCGVALGWMLTSSNRIVRDRATKGLVALFAGRLAALRQLLQRFHGVDDPYVAERLHAVAYGVATRCHDPGEIKCLASHVYDNIFADGAAPPHILMRDYARGVVERALYLGADVDVNEDLIRPPYHSEWPDVPNVDELARLAPEPDISTLDRFDLRRAEDAIRFSVMDSDFARYVIGTDHRKGPWLGLRLSEEPWRDPDELLVELETEFSDSSSRALAEFRSERQRYLVDSLFDGSAVPIDVPRLTPTGESAEEDRGVDDAADELADDDRRESSKERVEESLSNLLSSLSLEHRERFLALERARTENHYFDTKAIQRYVLWRVFDLGWSVERFGRFDLHVNEHWSRESHKPERIGKKYQWIAYHEMLAYLSDHFQFDSGYSDDPSRHGFNGPWQIRLRDIDPTAPTQIWTRGGSDDDERPQWSRGYEFDEWRPDLPTLEWLALELEDQELLQLLQVTNPQDGSQWLNLRALRLWREPGWTGFDDDAEDLRQVWIHANAYLVDVEQADAFCSWAQQVDFMGRWMPEPGDETEIFLGEHGWSPAYRDRYGTTAEIEVRVRDENPDCPTSVRLTAAEYLSEASGYDCSLEDSHSFVVPAPSLIDGVGLRWRGRDADFLDANERLGAFASDPGGGDTSLLAREDLLRRFLKREKLAIVWTVLGEKERITRRSRPTWSGSLRFTGAYRFDPTDTEDNQIQGAVRFHFQFPTQRDDDAGP